MKSTEFHKLVRDALEHLYDTAYLEVHPLLSQIVGENPSSRSTRAQKLRGLLKESVESLRPPQGLPASSPEWRSYLALRCRYVQGMTLGDVENELGLSRRQLQRETQKGLEALASILWESYGVETEALPLPAPATVSPVPELEIELNQWELAWQTCDVRALVNDTLWLLKATLEQAQTEIQVDLPDPLALVFVDATLTRQALFKIVRLLAQNTHSTFTLTATQKDRFMDIQLHSPACGTCSTANDWLAAQLLVRHQGGVLLLESNEEIGLQVTMSLPLAGQTRVLIIDDNPAILRLFERYLTPHHYEVIKAHSGLEVPPLVAESRPQVIILDVMMPNVDGWQVLRSLKQNPASADTPIIICSVLPEPELALSLGAHAYLKKPVDRLELLATVERLLKPVSPPGAKPPPAPPGN
jgi:CheY-like chemotaxis protein